MKLELSHDLLAQEIHASVTRSAPELVQIKQKEQYIQTQYAYYRDGSRSYLTREEMDELAPYLDLANISEKERDFVLESRRRLRQKQRIRIGLITLSSLVILIIAGALLYYAYQAELSDVRAREAASYSESIRLANLAQQEIGRGNRHNALLLSSRGARASSPPLPLVQSALTEAFHLGFRRIPLLIAKCSHDGAVKQVLFSPSDQLVLSLGEDRRARLWNMKGEPVAELTHDGQIIHAAAFSPDGQTIYTGAADGSIIFWNAMGNRLQSLDFGSEVTHLGATATHLVAIGYNREVKRYNLMDGATLEIPAPADSRWWAVQFSTNGDQLLLADRAGRLRLIDPQGNTVRRGQFSAPVDADRYAFHFLTNGDIRIAPPESAGWRWRTDGQVTSFSASSRTDKAQPATHNLLWPVRRSLHPRLDIPIPEAIQYKHALPDPEARYAHTGRYILSFNRDDKTFFLWSLEDELLRAHRLTQAGGDIPDAFPYPLADSLRHLLPIDWAHWSPDGARLFTASAYESKLWSADFELIAQWATIPGLREARFSENGKFLWSIYRRQDGVEGLAVRDSLGREVMNLSFPDEAAITEVLPFPDGRRVAVLFNSGRLHTYTLDGRRARTRNTGQSLSTGAFKEDGSALVLGFGDGWVRKWDLESDSILPIVKHNNNIFDVDIRGEYVLSGGGDQYARLTTLDGERLKDIRLSSYVREARFSPTGTHYFVRDENDLLVLLSVEGRDSLVLNPVNPVLSAAFTHDGLYLLLQERTGSKEQMRLTDLRGQTVAVYSAPFPIVSTAIAPDGRRVFSAGEPGALIHATPAGVLDWLATHPLAPFSEQERKLYGLSAGDAPGAAPEK